MRKVFFYFMAVQRIRKLGDPVLRKISEKVEKIDEEILGIIQDMIDTINVKDSNAVGLAAPQIGVLKRIIVLNLTKNEVFINPEIEILDRQEEEAEEGCLSLYSIGCNVKRPKKIRVKALTPEGEEVLFNAEGMLARIFLHEVDHLQGKLFIDYLDSGTKRELMLKISELNLKES